MRAIVIEDERKARLAICNLLESISIPVTVIGEADNGKDGMELIVSRLPDIVFVDIRMPQMDGLEMIRNLVGQGVETSFVIVSGYSEFEYAQKAIEYGVEGYILKPVTLEDVEKAVSKVFQKDKKHQVIMELDSKIEIQNLEIQRRNCHNMLVMQAIRYVDSHMGNSCRLSGVAKELKVSSEHLSRAFHDEMQMTFTDYVSQIKVSYAMSLLKKTDMRIQDIASAIGYENEKYFYNVFKEWIGVTPRQYRRYLG